MLQFLRRRQKARCDGYPQHGVARRRLVTPTLAGLQVYHEIVNRGGRLDGARYGFIAAEEHACRTLRRHILRGLKDTDGRTQFELRPQFAPLRSRPLAANVVPSVAWRSDGLQRTVRAMRMRTDPSCLLADLVFSHFQIEVRLQVNPVAIRCTEIG